MEDVDLAHAKDRLEELIQRATRGEDVQITAPDGARVRLQAIGAGHSPKDNPPERVPGRWKGRAHIPEDKLFEPLSEEELAWLAGDR